MQKSVRIGAFALAFVIVCLSFCKAIFFLQLKSYGAAKSYYFLFAKEENVEAGAEFAQLNGGAGYLLEYEGGIYVAISVYEREESALSVQKDLKEAGTATDLLRVGGASLRFTKKNAATRKSALRLLESYISVLNGCVYELEKGMTQENCKRLLTILTRQFLQAKKNYTEYEAFSKACGGWASRLTELCKATVYLKDLRYLLCQQVDAYAKFSSI